MTDDFSIDGGIGLKANRVRIASDETNNVHTLRASLSADGAPIDSDNPLAVSDADALAQLIANQTALTQVVQSLSDAMTDELMVVMKQVLLHLELVTNTVFHAEDVGD